MKKPTNRKTFHSMYLEKEFRNILFCKAYLNTGSLGQMALELGNSGKGRNGPMRLMWLGINKIPGSKIERLAKLARIPVTEVLSHEVPKEQNQLIDDWFKALDEYKTSRKKNSSE